MALTGLTKEQNEELNALHMKAIDYAQSFLEDYANTKKYRYLEWAEWELAKARAYLDLGSFEEDPRYREM